METLLRSVSPAFRQRIRKDRRVAVEIGAELKVIDGAEGFDQDFDALIRLHQKRWRERGEPGVFSSEKFTRFHRRLASRIIPKRWARLFTLSIKGEPVAALYDFVYEGKMYYYQSGLDLESGQLRSPGLLVRAYAIETAIKEGLAECDFLKGDIRGYKAGWRGQTRSVLQLRLARSHSKEAIYTVATRLVDGLRQVKRTIKSAAALAMSLSVTLRNL
jgi:CelD/BcsL family acetyltransferase involved in cellulose biosynthesis